MQRLPTRTSARLPHFLAVSCAAPYWREAPARVSAQAEVEVFAPRSCHVSIQEALQKGTFCRKLRATVFGTVQALRGIKKEAAPGARCGFFEGEEALLVDRSYLIPNWSSLYN